MNPETSDGQHLIGSVCDEGPTRAEWEDNRRDVVAGDWTEGPCAGDSFLGTRVGDTRSCDGGSQLRGLEGVVQNEAHAHSEGLESAESASMSETPDVVPRKVECSVLFGVVVEVWRDGLVLSLTLGRSGLRQHHARNGL